MSHATLYVRFPDGEIRYGWYDGTNNRVCAPLFAHPNDVWSARPEESASGEGGEPVRLATDYGGGWSWSGKATRERVTVGGEDEWPDYIDGRPDWARYPERADG